MSSQLQVSGEAKIRTIQGPVVANSGVITALDGDASQYVRGDGTLADFPTSTGGGSSVSYYLNSSVSQGTIGGVAYRQLSKTPISGAGTDITISANGYVASYLTDANDPALLEVPAGNFNCEFYFSVNSNNHNPYVYAELYKYDGTTFTLLGSNVAIPEYLTNGTTLSAYYFAIPVAVAALTITDRLAIRIYANVDGRVVTLHTENNHLCQVVTTFSKGLTSLNNLTRQVQFLATGTSGTDFGISSSVATHTFNLPIASATNTGKLSSTDWSTFNGKQPAGNYVTLDTTQTITAAKTFSLDITVNSVKVGEGGGSISGNTILGTGSLNANTTGQQNTAIGYATLNLNTSGYDNTSIGYGSLNLNTTGFNNTALGSRSLFSNTTGNSNTAVGYISLTNNTTGTFNTAIGYASLANNNGSRNIAIGYAASQLNTTGSNNTSIGFESLYINTAGEFNVAIGNYALRNNSNGQNVAIGYQTLQANTAGASNTAIGYQSMYENTTGTQNVALGLGTLGNNTSGGGNIAIGVSTLISNTTSSYNTGIGYNALLLTTGGNNIAIGFESGKSITTGTNNTIIGNFAGTSAMANNIVLADGAGNVRYQWNGTNNVFGNPISGTSAVFSGSLNGATFYSATGIFLSTSGQSSSGGGYATINGGNNYLDFRPANGGIFIFQFPYSTARTFTLPDATGTLALTSNLSAYLPLSGGTLTGALSGTSASFSSSLIAQSLAICNGYYLVGRNAANTAFRTLVTFDSSNKILIGQDSDITAITLGVASEAMRITSGGNVGIGNTNPLAKLSVVAPACIVDIESSTSTQYNGLELKNGGGSFYVGQDNSSGSFYGGGAYSGNLYLSGAYPMVFWTGGTERMRITSAGRVLIGTTSVSAQLSVNGATSMDGITSTIVTTGNTAFVSNVPASSYSAYWVCAGNTAGYISHPSTTTTTYYTGPSDLRLKSNINEWNESVLDLFSKVKPKTYNHIADNDESIVYKGFIAQEMVDKFPEAYQKDRDGFYANNPTGFIPYLVKAIQESHQIIKNLEARIVTLESKLN
jgi:hypothetical protein